ncbi:DNA-3-methyladenine glycosylase family protein [Flavobacterium sp. XGLA_31]|uniref:DNA-3-methyladenine glycosylase family protein n=1 Tax=Flavobacterium sp. XGLA_31 TaxID=3447666 RepID=UPI003F3FAE9B
MLEGIAFLSEKDEVLKKIVADFGFPIIQKRDEGFAALCHIILEQQVSIESANACYVKLQNHLGEINPENVLQVSQEELRSFGVSRQKSVYLKHLAEKVASQELVLESFRVKSDEQIREELLKLKGVGHWTIDVYLMFCLQTPDVIPLGDIAIKNTIKELYDIHALEAMEILSKNWKPYRTLASYILWHYYLKKRNKI